MSPARPTSQPHALLITVDHWAGALLGCAGHPAIPTPTLDALARSGTRFSNAYSECPGCIPALPRRPAGTVLAALRERGRHLDQQRGSHWPPPNAH